MSKIMGLMLSLIDFVTGFSMFSGIGRVTKFINETDHDIEFELVVPSGKIEVSGNFSIDKLVAKADSLVFHSKIWEFLQLEPGFKIQALIEVDGRRFGVKLEPKLFLHSHLVVFSYINANGSKCFSASFSSKLMEKNPVKVVDKVLPEINPVEVVDKVLVVANGHTIDIK